MFKLSDDAKPIVFVILFFAFSLLHIWLGRIESVLSFFTPPVCAFIMAAVVGSIKDFGKKLEEDTGQKGVKAANLFMGVFIILTIAFYGMGFIDRG